MHRVDPAAKPHPSESPPGPTSAAKLAVLERGGGHAQMPRQLLSDKEAAHFIGVGERTFAELVANATWLPVPIILSARLRRWDVDELVEALRTRAPRGGKGVEPSQLAAARRARSESLKAGAGGAA